jgi:trimethylamine:corrinoid methyltransferase-like protein
MNSFTDTSDVDLLQKALRKAPKVIVYRARGKIRFASYGAKKSNYILMGKTPNIIGVYTNSFSVFDFIEDLKMET